MSDASRELNPILGKYLNTMVADLGIEGKGEYLRQLFFRYEDELQAQLADVQRENLKLALATCCDVCGVEGTALSWHECAKCSEAKDKQLATVLDALRHAAQRNHDFEPGGCSACEKIDALLQQFPKPEVRRD